jgi:hypothetical protein
LHIEKLVQNKAVYRYDILTLQSETAKLDIEFCHTKRIENCFIHGVGEGVLKSNLISYWDDMTSLFRKVIIKNMVKVHGGFIKQNSK